jgi:hypothetical protein
MMSQPVSAVKRNAFTSRRRGVRSNALQKRERLLQSAWPHSICMLGLLRLRRICAGISWNHFWPVIKGAVSSTIQPLLTELKGRSHGMGIRAIHAASR